MNLGLVTSFIIAGVLMLSILSMNMNLSSSSTELTLTEVTREHTQTVAELITYDIPKIGYAKKGKVSSYPAPGLGGIKYEMIEVADSNKIIFHSDLDNNGSIEKVTWEFTTTPVSSTPNPNDYVLIRKVGTDVTQITLGVTTFSIRYYDTYGEPKTNELLTPVNAIDRKNIKQVEVVLICEASQKIYNQATSTTGRYVKSAWEKRFSPSNLENN